VTATFNQLSPACVVPALKGQTLPAARRALERAHCKLGGVKKRGHHRGTRHVASQSPRPGTHLRSGGAVGVTLR
jgi:beta-lactam-binding protein with PASTA domain